MTDKKTYPPDLLIASKSGPIAGYIVHDFPRDRRRIDVIIDVSRIERKCPGIENKQVRDER